MERFILKKLLAWKNSPYRKPLILKGVRQVGKTWILKEFGRRYYENTAYFNFDENEEYKQFFETTKDVDRILQNLMLASGQKIVPEKTLIIFDEVQDCPKVINSMKYFCENAPQYHVACAGSLLGIALAKPSSFPVGKVNFMQIDPMTFNEFLLANGDENLAQYLEQVDTLEPIPDAFFNPLYENENGLCGHSLEEAIRNVNRKHYNLGKRTSEKKLEFTGKSKTDFALDLIYKCSDYYIA